jgi:hypothetical protein
MTRATALTLLLGSMLLGALGPYGCATPPKPSELEAFEKLKSHPNLAAAQKRSPDLASASDALYEMSEEEWKSNDLENSRRDA